MNQSRVDGMQGVRGSNPRTSTKEFLSSKDFSAFSNSAKMSRDRCVSVYVSV